MTIPTYLPYFVLAGTVATIAAILYGLHRALTHADWPATERSRTVRGPQPSFSSAGSWRALALGDGALCPGPGRHSDDPIRHFAARS